MRSLLVAALFVGSLFFLAPRAACASEAPGATLSFADFVKATHARDASLPRGPIEEPEDWIAVAGIVCYAVLPVVFVVGLGFLAYEMWTRNADAALLGPASRNAWIFRGAAPPSGLVLLHF